jgi:hypothetical protein
MKSSQISKAGSVELETWSIGYGSKGIKVYRYKGIGYKAKGRTQRAEGKFSATSIFQNQLRD